MHEASASKQEISSHTLRPFRVSDIGETQRNFRDAALRQNRKSTLPYAMHVDASFT